MTKAYRIGIIVITIGGCVAFLALLLFLTASLTLFGRIPADFLPAEHTIAVLHHADAKMLDQYKEWLPLLDGVEADGTSTIAILRMPDSSEQRVTFTKNATAKTPKTYWPYVVEMSDPSVAALLSGTLQPLSKDIGYRNFLKTKKPDTAWVYMKRKRVPTPDTLWTAVLQQFFLQNAETLAFTHRGNTLHIELYGTKSSAGTTTLPRAPDRETLFAGSAMNAKTLLEKVQEMLPNDQQIILLSILRQHVRDLFGSAVSIEYDLLPLFSKSATLTVRTESGNTVFLLRGSVEHADALQQTLARMHEGWRSQHPAMDMLDMQLDTQFHMRSLRMPAANVEHRSTQFGEWDVQTSTSSDENAFFFTAKQDKEFSIATSASLVQESIEGNAEPWDVPTNTTMTTKAQRSVGFLKITPAQRDRLPFFLNRGTALLWNWQQGGSFGSITLWTDEEKE